MIKHFNRQLRQAMTSRRQIKLPNLGLIIAIVTTVTLGYIILSIIAVPGSQPRDINFASEEGTITAFSAIFLAMASAFSLASSMMLIRAKNRQTWLWIFMAVVFGFLSFDELLSFHEIIGYFIEMKASSGLFRNWNDVIVIIYGTIALPIMLVLAPKLMQYRGVIELFIVAFLLYVIHTIIDSTQEPNTVLSVILEESAKLICVEFLALAAFVSFWGILWNFSLLDKSQQTL
jgi:hypothetical protein